MTWQKPTGLRLMADCEQVVVRVRRQEDVEPLRRVLIEVHALDGYPIEGVAAAMAGLDSPRMLGAWVVEVGTVVAGQVMVSAPGPGDDAVRLWMDRSDEGPAGVAVVGRLFVAPWARGRGAGRALLEAAAAHAGALGRRAVLEVLDKDTNAIALYERLGWPRIGSFDHNYAGRAEPATAFVIPSA